MRFKTGGNLGMFGWAIALAALAPEARAAITIENGTGAAVSCRLRLADEASPQEVTIPAAAAQTIKSVRPVECQYQSDEQSVRYSLQPGRRYRFILSSSDRLELRSLMTVQSKNLAPLTQLAPTRPVASAAPQMPPAPARHWPHVREVKVLIAGGKEYRAFYSNWHERAREIVEAASQRFEQQFPIRFQVVGYREWGYNRAPDSASDAFEWLHKVDRGDADLVIGFTMVPFPGPRGEIRGVSQYFSRYVVIPDNWGMTGAVTRLVHELCHVFGAFHVAAADSVMQLGFEHTPKVFRFGEPAERMIELTKDVDLEQGVDSLSQETQQRIRDIYRANHHPLESVDEDPVVVGYRYQAKRSAWAGDTKRSERMQAIADRLHPPEEKPQPAADGLEDEKVDHLEAHSRRK